MTRALLLALALTSLAACETIKGAARDVQNAGRVVENAL
ncbi:MAG: EcnA/B family entericidin [Maritimibacter sp.]